MAVNLRMRRMGSKKRPFYRLVAADKRYQRDGRFLETIGYYDPMKKPYEFRVDREKVLNWLRQGAQMSDTVKSLLRKEGIVQEFNQQKASAKSHKKSKKESGSKEQQDAVKEASNDTQE